MTKTTRRTPPTRCGGRRSKRSTPATTPAPRICTAISPVAIPTRPPPATPSTSLWRAAQQAFNRGDYSSAANLYGDLTRRYPNSTRAGDALYWAAFALYKNDDLAHARSLLVTQQRRYPKAATRRDGDALFARIQTALAKQGDEEARRWLSQNAQPRSETDTTHAKGDRKSTRLNSSHSQISY